MPIISVRDNENNRGKRNLKKTKTEINKGGGAEAMVKGGELSDFVVCLEVVSATFLLVCFSRLKERTFETRKMLFISLRKLFSFLR